jgi:glyoxylase-like metal-dependent hydrolase (beta-lactamase superfamily II)
MIYEVGENLYKIEICLPKNPLKFANSYVIKNSERNLIIDSGMNRKECMGIMQRSLKELGVGLKKTDFFITHFHMDHIGLVPSLRTDKSIIFVSQPDAESVYRSSSDIFWKGIIDFTRKNGFPEEELKEALKHNTNYKYRLNVYLPFNFLEDKKSINIGNYQFRCVSTPGHSKGHMCLYDPNKKILVSGDHLLNDITPTIQLRSSEDNPLEEYLSSLDKIYPLNIELVLPGHGNIFKNCKGRIKALKDHHQKRSEEILSLLEKRSQNAYQVASMMRWDIRYDSWDLFPGLQKWFAIGETIAHLKFLEEKRLIQKEMLNQRIVYSLINEY